MSKPENRPIIAIPEPLQKRLLAKNEAFLRAQHELEELLQLTQELLQVPEGYVLQNVYQGFVPVEMLAEVPQERPDVSGAPE